MNVSNTKTENEMDVQAASDEELALALKTGLEAAFDELVRRHQGRVYATAFRLTSNREDALDVTQDALVKVYRKIEMWQPRSGFLPWLLRLTTNQALDLLRRRKRRKTEPLDEGRREPAHETAALGTEVQVHAKEIEDRVQEALSVLSNAQRAVFVMRHYEGLQLADIAEVLGCTVGSVKVHLFRALKKLRVELEDLHKP